MTDPDDLADPPPLDLSPAQEARDHATRDRAWIVASLAASQDLTDEEIADQVGCSRARVGQIRAEQGIAGRGAGRPRGEAITHRSQAGRLLLATLVDQAAQLGVTPGEIVAAGVEAIETRTEAEE